MKPSLSEKPSFQVIYEKSFNIDFFVPDNKHNGKVKAIVHHDKAIPVHIKDDLRQFFLKDGKLIEVVRSINNYSKYELLQYYYSLDPLSCNYQHYGLIRNECIRRDLIKGEILFLNCFVETNVF